MSSRENKAVTPQTQQSANILQTFAGLASGRPDEPSSNQDELRRLRSRADIIRQQSASLIRQATTTSFTRQVSGFYWPPGAEELVERISLYYATGWENPYVHYSSSSLGGKWTSVPGYPMKNVSKKVDSLLRKMFFELFTSASDSPETLWELPINDVSDLEFVFNKDGQFWDKCNGNTNYFIQAPGIYLIKHGKIHQIFDPPEKPTLFRLVNVGSSFVELTWNPPLIKVETVAFYRIFRDDVQIVELDGHTFNYKDTGLNSLQKYAYQVFAVNHNRMQGRSSDLLEVTTGKPGKASAVEGLRIIHHSPTSVAIAWQHPLDFGGTKIVGYQIYRNGALYTTEPYVLEDWQTWTDSKVEANAKYVYHVVATKAIHTDIHPVSIAAATKLSEFGSVEAEVYQFLIKLFQEKEKGYEDIGLLAPGVTAKAVSQLEIPTLIDKKTHIILQAFNWHSCFDDYGLFNKLAQKLEAIRNAAITMVWLPPPTQSVSPQGYMPTRWYNLNSEYGTEAELLDLIESLRAHKIVPMLDLVVNHRCGIKKDNQGEWTIFEDPPWESWAIVKNNLVGYTGLGEFDTGAQSECAPDIDHKNVQVRKDVKEWVSWLFEVIGFGAIRIDMAPGYSAHYQVEYVSHLQTPFAVGEYWSGDQEVLYKYVKACRNLIAVYDFALYYILRRSVESNVFYEMSQNGKPPGLIGRDSEHSVTFIENHDTAHLDFVGKFAHGSHDAVLRGYVYILTHPGIPCLFFDHFFDSYLNPKITTLCELRSQSNITSQSGVYIDAAADGLYAAYISQFRHCSRGDGTLAMKLGTCDWMPQGHNWKICIAGEQFCVWSRK